MELVNIKTKQSFNRAIAFRLQLSSSCFAVLGGVLLALNLSISGYGFLLLAMSSSQILAANILLGDRTMIFYAASLFCCVDCLGIYRWILS